MTYEAGLSGGSWLLSSIAANDWPTVSSLIDGLWTEAFQDSLFLPDGALAALALTEITTDIVAKQEAGFPPTLTGEFKVTFVLCAMLTLSARSLGTSVKYATALWQ